MVKTRRIAYIPARSGSKGVPKKNIRMICGKPLLGWMVQAAIDTGLFDKIMVSTDSREFADVAEACGAWVPFLRDQNVATDSASTIEAICSDKLRLERMGEVFDIFCLLQVSLITSPHLYKLFYRWSQSNYGLCLLHLHSFHLQTRLLYQL